MTVHKVHFDRYRRLGASKNPRKLYLSTPVDRFYAALSIRIARDLARKLQVRGYDRHLLLAAQQADLAGHTFVARQLASAALD